MKVSSRPWTASAEYDRTLLYCLRYPVTYSAARCKNQKVIAGFLEVKSTDLLQIVELLLQTLIGAPVELPLPGMPMESTAGRILRSAACEAVQLPDLGNCGRRAACKHAHVDGNGYSIQRSGPAYSKIVFREPASLPRISESSEELESAESADPIRLRLLETLGSGGEQILIYEKRDLRPWTASAEYDRTLLYCLRYPARACNTARCKIKKVIAGFLEVKSTDLQIVELLLQTLIGAPEIQTSLAEHADGKIHFLNHDAVIVGGQDMV